jgi:hypothetical protein
VATTGIDSAVTAPAKSIGENRRKLRLPFADRLVAKDSAALEEHFGQIAQGQAVAYAPEHHQRDHVGGILAVVQQPTAALVVLLAAPPAAEPAVAPGRALQPLRHSLGAAGYTVHPDSQPAQPRRYQP